ncbi:pitrilysin family protein [Massilia sp. 9096]|uniref:M16 family metallopeptidase n=1 Tax=Massilia sp. 9096 TaxID=1500894 RepID=UPI000567603A|nr:insulinase family protein [Massilia sp. 9096]
MPDYAKDKPLPVPQIAKKKLASGLEVWVPPRTGVLRVDMVLAVRDAGLGADDHSRPGSPTCWPKSRSPRPSRPRTAPTAESIGATGEELLRSEHARRFRPERALLVITGRIGEAEAMRLAQQAIGEWKASGPAAAGAPRVAAAAKPVRRRLERAGSVQSTVRVGGPGIPAAAGEQIPLRLASTILGGGFSSRVNLKLREEKDYTYGASAGATLLREGGNVAGGADVRNEVTGATLADYLAEYKRYVAGSYLLRNQMLGEVAGTLASNWLVGLPAEFLGQYVPLIEKVTPEQVRAVAKKYLAPENQSIVAVGDAKAVGEQLKPFGAFTVTEQ